MINGNATYSNNIRARFRLARVLCCVPILALASVSSSVLVRQSTGEKNFAKSSAQVATLVSPQAVSPKSCELKLEHRNDKGPKAKRRNPLTVRLSDAERAVIEAKAHAAGCSTNRYVRAAALGSDYKQPHDPEWTKALLATNRELTGQGRNLNQIAKLRNGGKASIAEEDGMLGVLARSMLPTHKAVRDALIRGKEPEP